MKSGAVPKDLEVVGEEKLNPDEVPDVAGAWLDIGKAPNALGKGEGGGGAAAAAAGVGGAGEALFPRLTGPLAKDICRSPIS